MCDNGSRTGVSDKQEICCFHLLVKIIIIISVEFILATLID